VSHALVRPNGERSVALSCERMGRFGPFPGRALELSDRAYFEAISAHLGSQGAHHGQVKVQAKVQVSGNAKTCRSVEIAKLPWRGAKRLLMPAMREIVRRVSADRSRATSNVLGDDELRSRRRVVGRPRNELVARDPVVRTSARGRRSRYRLRQSPRPNDQRSNVFRIRFHFQSHPFDARFQLFLTGIQRFWDPLVTSCDRLCDVSCYQNAGGPRLAVRRGSRTLSREEAARSRRLAASARDVEPLNRRQYL
jgi:hypothetical protein